MVLSVLRKLDQVPLQVLIEATIAEVTLNETLRYGVQWFFKQGNSQLTLNSGSTSSIAPSIPGFSYFLKGPDVQEVLDALETVTDLNVISSPQLMVLDNQTAELQVGDQVPVLTQQATGVENVDSVITSSVEYRDSGIILRVTPRVNAGGLVSMSIEQEASLIAKSAEPTLTPTIQQRRISSSVAVQSGETVVLGGLIQDSRDRKESGVPLLRRIPGLGFFFGAKENDKSRTELLVLITPRAVRNQREVRDVTNEMRKRLRAVIPLDMKIR
jgi:general secretion pathway protein D